MLNSADLMQKDNDCILHTYARSPLVLERGQGMTAYDADGNAYLDFTSGIGVNALGFAHPAWVAAVTAQAGRLQHISNLYYTVPCVELAARLCARSGLDKVFFGNSGAEANEGAIKAARKYSVDVYGPQRSGIVTLQNSFHGRTLATLTATGQDGFHHDFGPFPAGFSYAPANDMTALAATVDDTTCAVFIELVQGEGGVIALEKDYVQQLAAFCAARDILLIVDEVQTGIGRTGTLFAYQQYGILPDIVSSAKGLGGGLPLGAVLMRQKVAEHMTAGSHGSTFGGNPVACAGACAVLDTLDDAFLAGVRERAALLRTRLNALPRVTEVSGLGLMVGLALEAGLSAAAVRAACEKAGLLVLTAKTRVRLLPPLILTEADIDAAVAILQRVLTAI